MANRRGPRILLLIICALFLAAAAVPFVIPPRPVLRALALWSSDCLLTANDENDGRLMGSAKRIWRAYVQSSVAAYMGDRMGAQGGSDEIILQRIMVEVRNDILNHVETEFIGRPAPAALLTGIGVCDQINGAVCTIAARHFEPVELIGLYDARTKSSPHTIGRAWSKQRGEWLYFDAFFSVPVIFTRDADGTPHYLPLPSVPPIPSRLTPLYDEYKLPAWRMAGFRKSFAAQLIARARRQRLEGSSMATAPAAVTPDLDAAMMAVGPIPPPKNRNDEVYERIGRSYVDARLTHLSSGRDRDAYRAIATDPAASADDRAAQLAQRAAIFANMAP